LGIINRINAQNQTKEVAKGTLPQTCSLARAKVSYFHIIEFTYYLVAIYRLSSKSISRSKGQSAVASASYRSAEKLYDERIKKQFDYSKKHGVSHTEILLPENIPEQFKDRSTLWNEVEKSEKRINSELAKEYQLALPLEVSTEEKIKLVKDFANEQFVKKGLGVDLAFHHLNDENPHCHLMVTTREITAEGLGAKLRFFKDRQYLIDLRKDWEISINRCLERNGVDQRVSADSFKSQGCDLKGVSVDAYSDNADIQLRQKQEDNTNSLLGNPGQIADILSARQAMFTSESIVKFIDRHVIEEKKKEVITALYNCKNLIDLDGGKFTSLNYLKMEQSLSESTRTLADKGYYHAVDMSYAIDVADKYTLNESQRNAFGYVLNDDRTVKSIIGMAGTGKSHVLKAVAEVYEQQGYQLKGVALSGIVAENLSKDANISDSKTLHSFLYRYELGREDINEKSIIVLDEASMVGVQQMSRLFKIVDDHSAKIICVGDNQQLQAIDAGGAFRMVTDKGGYVALDEILRQNDEKDRIASLQLATGDSRGAFNHYNQKHQVYSHETKEEAISAITNGFMENNLKGKSQILLAHRRKDVSLLNDSIQQARLDQGDIKKRSISVDGQDYHVGDKFIFLKNDRQLDVKNGTIGTIDRLQGAEFQIKTNDHRMINFNADKYKDFGLGYAVTIHKSQGVTVDHTELYLDNGVNSNLAYVGMTRHKDDVSIHYTSDQLNNGVKDFNTLIERASRVETKALIDDYVKDLDQIQNEKHPEVREESLNNIRTNLHERSKTRANIIGATQDLNKVEQSLSKNVSALNSAIDEHQQEQIMKKERGIEREMSHGMSF